MKSEPNNKKRSGEYFCCVTHFVKDKFFCPIAWGTSTSCHFAWSWRRKTEEYNTRNKGAVWSQM